MNARTVELTVKPVLDAVTVRPGDTLVVKLDPRITDEQAKYATDYITEYLPGVKVLVVGADQLLVYRPDGAA